MRPIFWTKLELYIDSKHSVDIIASRRVKISKKHPQIEKYLLKARYMGLPEKRWLQVLKGIFLVLIHFWRTPKVIARSLNYQSYNCPSMDIYLRVIYATILLSKTQNKEYDIIHCHLGYVGIMGVALRRIGMIKGKIVTSFHSADAYTYPKKWKHNVYETLWKYGELNTVGSNYMGNTIKSLGAFQERVEVLRLGLDLKNFAFKERKLEKGATIQALTITRLVEKKGLKFAIRGFSEVCKKTLDKSLMYQNSR